MPRIIEMGIVSMSKKEANYWNACKDKSKIVLADYTLRNDKSAGFCRKSDDI
jgi:hypothetical protein